MSIIQVNTIRSRSGASAPECDQGLIVSGIATLGAASISLPAVKISNGIVTATTGIVTYFGDGQYLQNAGVAVTYIPNNLNIAGITTISPRLHVGTGVTINTQGLLVTGIITASSYRGSGSALTGIVTTLSAGSDITIVSSGSTTGTGIVTVSVNQTSLFTNKAVFTPTATGIATTSNVSIGTTIASNTLTVSGTIGVSGTVTAPNFQGIASTSTTINVVSTASSAQIHYVNFSNITGGNTEVRADQGLSYYPGPGILSTEKLIVAGIVTSTQLQVGTDGSSIVATGIGSIGIKNQYPRYPFEVGGLGATGVTQFINGDLQTSQHIDVGGSANIAGVVTANNFVGNGFGLVGIASTVKSYYIEYAAGSIGYGVTWAIPPEINWVLVQCIGGGGGGNSRSTCAGGGSGAVIERLFRANYLRTRGTNFSVFVGAGGTAGASPSNNGGSGGESKFEVEANEFVIALGGGGAQSGVGGTSGDVISTGLNASATSGYYAAAGGSNGSASVAVRGGSSLFGPGAGGAGISGVTPAFGGRSLSRGSAGPAGMGTGGNGGNATIVATAGGFPGGGGGGCSAGIAGTGGGGSVRIWAW
jgi:hypothetical protein